MTDGASIRRRAAAHVLVDDWSSLAGDEVIVDDDLEHHLRRVLRLRDGEQVTVSDGAGAWRLCRVTRGSGRNDPVRLAPDGEVVVEPEPGARLTVATAIPKGDRADWMVQKATEIGVDRIVLLHCDHSVVRLDAERAPKQLARFQRIADEATRQSRRVWRTEVAGPVDSIDVLPDAVAAEPEGRAPSAEDRTVAIGPEGGWSATELAECRDTIGLGPHVLRTETAVLVSIALWVADAH